ncbi:hypothetical protein ACQPZX_41505 [Actinoplanes sp. CA-142083]|uniref:hypothetical protein n=1 Tax=Actinoplanes sp. CA-142083 TaxID=3239903 RepID=UPI003D8D8BC2
MTTQGISDAELALLIAGLQPEPVAATPAPRCELTDLLTDQCAHCQGVPDAEPVAESQLGPWFACQQPGRCSGCSSRFAEFDFIRADGEGGWLAQCCSEMRQDAGGGIVAAPKPAGPPPSTVRELRQVLIDFEANRPRSMQTALGPSELGTACQQQIGRKLAGAPRRPITEPTWAPFQGTAVHASMADEVVPFWNKQLGRERWLAEDRLAAMEALPGVDGGPAEYPAVEGNGDAYDQDHDMVVDWKHVGTTALDKLRAGKRRGMHPAEQVSPEYRVQGHIYGLGHAAKGRKVRWVRLVLLARSWKYDDSEEWTEEYREDIAMKAITRYWDIVDLVHALGGAEAGDLITTVPAAPGKDTCKWCPFYRPGVTSDWNGCAGDRPPAAHVARATAGLIEDSGPQPAAPAIGA